MLTEEERGDHQAKKCLVMLHCCSREEGRVARSGVVEVSWPVTFHSTMVAECHVGYMKSHPNSVFSIIVGTEAGGAVAAAVAASYADDPRFNRLKLVVKFGFGASSAFPPGAICSLGEDSKEDNVPLSCYLTSRQLLKPDRMPTRAMARRYYAFVPSFPSGHIKNWRDNTNLQGGVEQDGGPTIWIHECPTTSGGYFPTGSSDLVGRSVADWESSSIFQVREKRITAPSCPSQPP